MKKLRAITWLAAVGMIWITASEAKTRTHPGLPPAEASAPAAGTTRPVPAWRDLCQRHPEECAVDLAEPAVLKLDRAGWQLILSVNARVNAAIRPLTDEAHWGVMDDWDFPHDGYGDCEDYQLLKRKLLVEAGLPRRALRMTVVIDEKGEGHAVLMVRTDRGDFILDNKTSAVLPWHRTAYVFIKREAEDGAGWTSLGGATAPVATANR